MILALGTYLSLCTVQCRSALGVSVQVQLSVQLRVLADLVTSQLDRQPVAVVWYRQIVHSLSNKDISTVSRLVVVKHT